MQDFDTIYSNLFQNDKLVKQRDELLREFMDYAANNLHTVAIYLSSYTYYNKEIIDSIKINDYETMWDFVQLNLSENNPALYCQYYRKLLKIFPQLRFNMHIACSFPLDVFKENYDILFNEMSDEDFDSYISKHITYGSVDTLCYLLKQKTNYPLIKIIYAYMHKGHEGYLQEFIEWTKSSDCISEIEIQHINTFNNNIYSSDPFDFYRFVDRYYNYPEYYSNFEVQENNICYFYNLKTQEKFLELYEYGYMIVSKEKIFNDFIIYAVINTYEEFTKIMHIYEKKGLYFDFFCPVNEEKIINLLVSDINEKSYIVRKINFFEKYYNHFFRPQILDNYHYEGALSISAINFIVERTDKVVDLTKVFVAFFDSFNKYFELYIWHLTKLFNNNRITINLNYIFITCLFANKYLSSSSHGECLIELIDECKDEISFTDEEKIMLNSGNTAYEPCVNQLKKYNLI
jgi:hypothetical protein